MAAVLGQKSEANFKQTAKKLSELSGLAVFWVFSQDYLYYTGLSNLLSQPEFARQDLVCAISATLDKLDEAMPQLLRLAKGRQVFLDQDSLLGRHTATITQTYRWQDRNGLIGLVGPLRLNYGRALGLLQTVANAIVT